MGLHQGAPPPLALPPLASLRGSAATPHPNPNPNPPRSTDSKPRDRERKRQQASALELKPISATLI